MYVRVWVYSSNNFPMCLDFQQNLGILCLGLGLGLDLA